ncbi:MAG TPA: hypothetical protein VGN88_01275 [Phycisphaerae bacterium]
MSGTDIVLYCIRGIIVLLVIALGWREIALLFRAPAKNMGAGWARVWAVGRTTVLEAWAGRVWLLPVLWMLVAGVLIMSVRPFDESERIPLYIRMLLSSQEVLVLVMMWVMACVSLPRERERKILVTNASKPLSRLEIVLGKVLGFSLVSGLSLAVMGGVSLVVLHVSDMNLRSRAKEAYQLQERDFQTQIANAGRQVPAADGSVASAGPISTPSEALNQLSEEGSLFAYNYITVPRENMSILGLFDGSKDPPERWIKGGSYEKISYVFRPRLIALSTVMLDSVGTRPHFEFIFPFRALDPSTRIEIEVNAYCSQSHRVPPPKPQTKTLTLDRNGVAVWEPDMPEDLYSLVEPTPDGKGMQLVPDSDQGEVTVEVTCKTPGVLLQVLDGADPDPTTGKIPAGTDFNVFFYPDPRSAVSIPPMARPITRGFERRDRQEISGPKKDEQFVEYAIYRFPGSSLKNIPLDDKKNFTLSVQFETYKSDNPTLPTMANIDVFSLDSTAQRYSVPSFQIRERRLTQISIPDTCLGNPDPSKRGDMFVRVCTFTEGHSISLLENSVRIELPQTPFFVNLLQSELVLFLEVVLVVSVSVMCSIRVGWPIAMFCSAMIFMFGDFIEFINGLQEYGGLGALNYHAFGANQTLFNFFDTTTSMLWKFLGVISALAPNFTVYRADEYIARLQHMPWTVLADNMFSTLTFALPLIGLAYLFFRKQELG